MQNKDPFSGRPIHLLSREEAGLVLDRFLDLGREALPICKELVHKEGQSFDFSEKSLLILFKAVAKLLRFEYRPLPNDIPQWVRESSAHSKGLVEFDEPSRVWIMRVAYCLGEFFIRSYPALHWAVGAKDFADENMPVVAGFRAREELPPLSVTEGMFSRTVAQGKSWDQVTTMVDAWRKSAP